MVNVVVEIKAVPPLLEAYHLMAVPVTTKFETVALPQKVCALDVGAGVAPPIP